MANKLKEDMLLRTLTVCYFRTAKHNVNFSTVQIKYTFKIYN